MGCCSLEEAVDEVGGEEAVVVVGEDWRSKD